MHDLERRVHVLAWLLYQLVSIVHVSRQYSAYIHAGDCTHGDRKLTEGRRWS